MVKKIAVIGAGIVGSTAAYLLSGESNIEVTIFDDGTGQGTKASAGIISPWLSRRRNKKWYKMVKDAAAFYPGFIKELSAEDPGLEDVYKQTGTLLFKSKPEYLEEMLEIGLNRLEDAPEIGELKILSPEEIKEKFPIYENDKSALWASGGARVDGGQLVKLLLGKSISQGARFVPEKAVLAVRGEETYGIKSPSLEDTFDQVVLANSAWLGEFLEPFDYEVDIRPQKGQLIELQLTGLQTTDWPVIMPEGEMDIIPFNDGRVVVGATHEDDKEYDLTIEEDSLMEMIDRASMEFSPALKEADVIGFRSGTRAYTSDFSPFFGEVPGMKGVVAASGLGSTGLTAGPLAGKILTECLLGVEPSLPLEDYPIEKYVKPLK